MREGLLAVGSSQLSVGGSLQPGCYAPITDNRQRTTENCQLSPFRMKSPLAIRTLISMRTEIVTLSLHEIQG